MNSIFQRRSIRCALLREDGQVTLTFALNKPTYGGYSVTLKKAVNIIKGPQNVSTYDNGITNDYRQLNFKALLDSGSVQSLGEWVTAKRTSWIRYMLQIPQNSGFHPFGPDYPDSGNFFFEWADNWKISSMKIDPYGKFECHFSMILTPERNEPYHPQDLPKDLGGHFAFGSVDGLRDPQISPVQEWGVKSGISLNGAVETVLTPTNEYTSQLTIRTTRAKMANLIDYIQKNRGEYIPVSTGENYFLWGGQERD